MKSKFAKAISVCAIVAMTGLSTVGAATVYNNVSATLRPDIMVKYNNEAIELKDSNDELITPIIINGSTYLPIRAIANLTGLNIDWDNESQTILIEDMTEEKDEIGVRGVVKNLVKGKDGVTFLIEGKLDEDTMLDKAYVTVNMQTTVMRNGVEITRNFAYGEIKEGDIVEAVFTGPIAKSYPAQAMAKKINILSEETNSPVINAKVKAPDVVGKIIEIEEGGKRVLVDSKDTTVNGLIWITINEETNFFENISEDIAIGYRNVSREFKVGNHVEIIIDGAIMESYPMQAAADAVAVNEKR
ncbi:hypothetical protein HNQ80_004505 [Anaerosolibacter carboniphilus]|uniref:Copper amine oxidase-like N-terminal domain-containing protein n=1 Tax=Anaerosolibacter carboniphilus TaxID=1417629 RepID=A0A841KY05_9FIRM|nr:DUF3221 domain-containing protein [Anaerosolibacter carboniphilus]MBB6218341.1 hypothetical protein [Anaerosolibacter carboniphilus]